MGQCVLAALHLVVSVDDAQNIDTCRKGAGLDVRANIVKVPKKKYPPSRVQQS